MWQRLQIWLLSGEGILLERTCCAGREAMIKRSPYMHILSYIYSASLKLKQRLI